MMLPPEVFQVAIATHRKYITLEYDSGEFSPFFVVVSNRLSDKARDKRIIKGNQRVLRARLSDAEFFWKQDTSRPLESYINALRDVTFYQGLGSIYDKTKRLQSLVEKITPYVVGADVQVTLRTAKLSKADLVTSMVREFPELQGVVGGYYARASGEKDQVSEAISEHYRPQGAKDELPSSPEAIIVSLADKLDTLTGFFCIGVKPTGSKDPFALRRAALGVIRIIIDCGLKIPLKKVLDAAVNGYDFEILDPDLMPFIRQRLFVHLRDQKMRHDIVAASLASSDGDDISIITNRARALATFIDSNDGLALVGVRDALAIYLWQKKKGLMKFLVLILIQSYSMTSRESCLISCL